MDSSSLDFDQFKALFKRYDDGKDFLQQAWKKLNNLLSIQDNKLYKEDLRGLSQMDLIKEYHIHDGLAGAIYSWVNSAPPQTPEQQKAKKRFRVLTEKELFEENKIHKNAGVWEIGQIDNKDSIKKIYSPNMASFKQVPEKEEELMGPVKKILQTAFKQYSFNIWEDTTRHNSFERVSGQKYPDFVACTEKVEDGKVDWEKFKILFEVEFDAFSFNSGIKSKGQHGIGQFMSWMAEKFHPINKIPEKAIKYGGVTDFKFIAIIKAVWNSRYEDWEYYYSNPVTMTSLSYEYVLPEECSDGFYYLCYLLGLWKDHKENSTYSQ